MGLAWPQCTGYAVPRYRVVHVSLRSGVEGDAAERTAMSVIDISPLSWEALLCCFLSGIIIGLERQLRGKPVGMRTSTLICIGTYVFIAMGECVATQATDPSRIIGQVVTGIGFLGAGVILARHGAILGVTSASAIWVLAALGVVDRARTPLAGRQARRSNGGDSRRRGPRRAPLRAPPARRSSQPRGTTQAPAGSTMATNPGLGVNQEKGTFYFSHIHFSGAEASGDRVKK